MDNRLGPLLPPYSKETETLLDQYPRIEGYLLNLFRTFANSTRFLTKGVPNLLDKESPLDLRTREVVILRVTAKYACEYEWGVHISVFAKAAQITRKQIKDICKASADKSLWSAKDYELIGIIDQLTSGARLDPPNSHVFQKNWRKEEQLEIIALVGAYHTVSMVANVSELEPESFAARFPDK